MFLFAEWWTHFVHFKTGPKSEQVELFTGLDQV